ncbi:MAG TPA: chaperone NapD [Gammaproteobacteria bacterium]
MNISGVLIHARPENCEKVKQQLEQVAGVEVYASTDEGKLVVTVEASGDRSAADTVYQLQDMPGVISASMVYHHFEDDAELQQEASDETEQA